MTCRYYGISRPCFYKWLRRYVELGEEGLRDGSSRPLNSPRATKTEAVGKIVYLRENYHFGPQKILMYLKRYHDITISPSGVWNILHRLGISRLPSSQRYERTRTVGSVTRRNSQGTESHRFAPGLLSASTQPPVRPPRIHGR